MFTDTCEILVKKNVFIHTLYDSVIKQIRKKTYGGRIYSSFVNRILN